MNVLLHVVLLCAGCLPIRLNTSSLVHLRNGFFEISFPFSFLERIRLCASFLFYFTDSKAAAILIFKHFFHIVAVVLICGISHVYVGLETTEFYAFIFFFPLALFFLSRKRDEFLISVRFVVFLFHSSS